MPFLQLTTDQIPGSHFSKAIGLSSKIVPTLAENCFLQARHFQIRLVERKDGSVAWQCGQATPSGHRRRATKARLTSGWAKNWTASSREWGTWVLASIQAGTLPNGDWCVKYITDQRARGGVVGPPSKLSEPQPAIRKKCQRPATKSPECSSARRRPTGWRLALPTYWKYPLTSITTCTSPWFTSDGSTTSVPWPPLASPLTRLLASVLPAVKLIVLVVGGLLLASG
jgi:hypothetical protein